MPQKAWVGTVLDMLQPVLKDLRDVRVALWPQGSAAPAPLDGTDLLSSPKALDYYTKAVSLLPEEVRTALAFFQKDPPKSGALLIQGLPVGSLPSTPESPKAHLVKDWGTETLLLTTASALGYPVGYAPEHGGDLVQNIVPTRTSADRQVSTSSKVRLEFHTEAAFHPYRPRYLLLFCLRGDPSAATTLASVRDAVGSIEPEVLSVLRQTRFATGVDESYLGYRSSRLGQPMAAISGLDGEESICFDGDLMQGLDPEAAQALEILRRAIDDSARSIVLASGDLLVVDNHIAVHGRSPFTPRFDGTDRWLQRSFVLDDLDGAQSDIVNRVISTRFYA